MPRRNGTGRLTPESIRALRAETGWSQAYLARLLHTTPNSIWRYENGRAPIEGLVGAYLLVLEEAVRRGNAREIERAVNDSEVDVFVACVDAARAKVRPRRKPGPTPKKTAADLQPRLTGMQAAPPVPPERPRVGRQVERVRASGGKLAADGSG